VLSASFSAKYNASNLKGFYSGKNLVENYGVKVDQELLKEVLPGMLNSTSNLMQALYNEMVPVMKEMRSLM